jgi:nucleoid-associated protein YgaU
MGLFSFVKSAGAKLFADSETPEEKVKKVQEHVAQYGFDLSDITFSVEDKTVTVSGKAKNLDEKQKIIATAGNVKDIEGVIDELEVVEPVKVELPDLSKLMYTVVSGDSLSKIAKRVYGDAMKYPVIFEANKPMLKDPNKIYPGQVLYIPPLA